MKRGYAYGLMAMLCWSTGGILQRQVSAGAVDQLVGRAFFAFIALSLFLTASCWGDLRLSARALITPAGVGVAVGLAVASGSFIIALNHTTVAHAYFFQAIVPVAAAALSLIFLHERLSPRTWLAIVLAVIGIGVIAGYPASSGSPLGDGLAALSPLAFAVVIVIARVNPRISIAPATCASQLLLVLGGLPFVHLGTIHVADIGWLALLGIGQQGAGLLLFTIAAALLPAATMGLLVLLESVFGSAWAWIGASEHPTLSTLVGGAIVIGAVAMKHASTKDEASVLETAR